MSESSYDKYLREFSAKKSIPDPSPSLPRVDRQIERAMHPWNKWRIRTRDNGQMEVVDERGMPIPGISKLEVICDYTTNFIPRTSATVIITEPDLDIEFGISEVDFDDRTEITSYGGFQIKKSDGS